MLLELLIFILTTTVIYFFYEYKRIHKYFDDRDVKYLSGLPIFGNVIGTALGKKHYIEDLDKVYNAFPDEKYVGFSEFTIPIILIRDPDIIKNIVVKDFDHFTDHREFLNVETEPLFADGMFLMKGDRWRDMRTTLSPAFTSSKMKYMLPFILEITKNFVQFLNEHENEDIDVDDFIRRFTNDVIASAVYGVQINSIKERNNEFFKIGSGIFDFNFRQKLILMMGNHFPALNKIIKTRLFHDKIYDFFPKLVSSAIDYRKKNKLERPDMIQLLLEAKKEWTIDEITGQVFIFFTAGYETTASALVMSIHEWALNTEIQEKLYQECKKFKGNEFSFDNLSELKYLDAAINETLRKWCPAVILDRICTKTYELPAPREGGKPYKMQPGEILYNLVNQVQMDEKYWPEPQKYQPERFLEENKHNIKPYTFMPFGVGPRACIGMRFAMMEIKVLAYYLIVNFKIIKTEKTLDPIKLKPHNFNIGAMNGTNVRFIRRTEE